MKPTNWLTNWYITRHQGRYVIVGYIENPFHKYHGQQIRTSQLLKIDFLNKYAETKNRIYKLLSV